MNEFLPDVSGPDGQTPATFTPAHVHALLDGALKSPKVTMGAIRGIFDIERDDIENFYYLIHQRISGVS